MIRISDKARCTGCTACVAACPKQCIVLRRDKEGFDYPVVNPDLCIDCGLCEQICPVLNPSETVEISGSYAARKDDGLEKVSSGGVFPLIAERFVANGGIVCGAVIDENCCVVHADVSCVEDLHRLQGSKYVQSELYSIFEDVKSYLQNSRKVLFSGTPCQIAGLKAFLRKDYENLYTVDVACHGVPSPGLWDMYKKQLESCQGDKLVNVVFRDKSQGWRHYGVKYEFSSCTRLIPAVKDLYMALFFQGVTLRPSCYACTLRGGRSGSDMTLSDLWSVQDVAPEFNDDKGASGVLINSRKGQELFDDVKGSLTVVGLSPSDIKAQNSGFCDSFPVPESRQNFFKGLHSTKDLYALMSSFIVKKPLAVRIYRGVRAYLSSIKRQILK